jgi:hypothetical protein
LFIAVIPYRQQQLLKRNLNTPRAGRVPVTQIMWQVALPDNNDKQKIHGAAERAPEYDDMIALTSMIKHKLLTMLTMKTVMITIIRTFQLCIVTETLDVRMSATI